VSATRTLLGRGLCAAILVVALVVPGATRADSTGVPLLVGVWTGTLTSTYWDQTSASIRPRYRFRSKVTLTIVQALNDGALAAAISYDPPLPTSPSPMDDISVGTLSGNVGNFHLGLADEGATLSIALSGAVNARATSMRLAGVATSSSYTHELIIKLRPQK
jgi:hypothetical protein